MFLVVVAALSIQCFSKQTNIINKAPSSKLINLLISILYSLSILSDSIYRYYKSLLVAIYFLLEYIILQNQKV